MPKLKYDLTGQRFGIVTALRHVRSGDWLIRCDCGVEKIVAGQNLRTGLQKSCGCANPAGKAKGGPDHPRWKSDDQIRYSTAHRRVSSKRGPAREHPCVGCDGEAHAWAYRGGSDRELTEVVQKTTAIKKAGDTIRYSPDPADYDPMCWRCHVRMDLARSRA